MAWYTEGVQATATADDILADTGPESLGTQTFSLLISSVQAGPMTLHLRNALNTGDVHTHRLYFIGGTQVINIPVTFTLNQRLTVTCDIDWEYTVQVSIFT